MAFTYTSSPMTVPRDAVRWLCGDTVEATAQLQDGEIEYAVAEQPTNSRLAAATCLDALAAKYARMADISIGDVSKRYGDRSNTFRQRAVDLRNEAGKLAVPFFGGQSQSAKDLLGQNVDAVQPHFAARQFDNPLSRQFDGQAPDPLIPEQ